MRPLKYVHHYGTFSDFCNIVKKNTLCYYTLMIGFFIKKAFYDGWDNLFQLLILNLFIIGIGIGGYYLASLTAGIVPLSISILIIAAVLEGIILTAVSIVMARVSNYKAGTIREFFAAVKETWKDGILYALVIAGAVIILSVAIPYYLRLGSFLGYTLAMLIFWVAVILVLAFQWFLPIRSQLDKKFSKCLRKCFIIFFDNPGFSVFMFLYSAILLAISFFVVFLIPGFAGIILAQNEAFRLRMYKYDWIEQHPEIEFKKARKQIPWTELLEEDDETTGHRTWRSFIFPWKD